MVTIVERIEWILAQKKVSRRELSRRAGLSESHVSLLLKALTKDPTAIELGTARGIARASNIRTSWLLTGQEPREPYEGDEPAPAAPAAPQPLAVPERVVVLDPRYQAMETAIAYHPGRWSPSEIAVARTVALEAESLSPQQATAILDAAAKRLKGFSLGDVDVGDDEAVPRRAKKG